MMGRSKETPWDFIPRVFRFYWFMQILTLTSLGMGLAYGKSHARMENIFRIEGLGICLAYGKSHAKLSEKRGLHLLLE